MSCPTWKEVAGYYSAGTAMYRVSTDGRIESRWDNRCIAGVGKWRPLKPVACKRRGGYLKVTLCGFPDDAPSGRRRDQRYVHDLILEAFVGPAPPGMEACHDPDHTPTNNAIANLRWGTRSDNVRDMIRQGRHFTPFAIPPILDLARRQELRLLHRDGESTRALAAAFGISKTAAHAIVSFSGTYRKDPR